MNIDSEKNTGPIVVGGVGGSGTRVIAQMLLDANVYMGGMLNDANDNLWFTLLLRRPEWFAKATKSEVFFMEQLFHKVMRGGEKFSLQEKIKIYSAVYDFIRYHYIKRDDWYSLPIDISKSILKTANEKKTVSRWGWKEPNSTILISSLAEQFPKMKYLLLMRNGFDMAFSSNQLQLRLWGKKYGVTGNSPEDSLQHWIIANDDAIAQGQQFLGERFRILKLEDLCAQPKQEIESLFKWMEIECDKTLLDKLSLLPKLPKTTGRYKEKDLSIFTSQQFASVNRFGYNAEK